MKRKLRARTEEEKTEKGRIILDAALRLFKNKEYKEITVSMIARNAKIAKSTVFIYFSTKEELFLSLAGREFDAFFHSLNTHMTADNSAPGIDGLVTIILKSIEENADFIKISPLMNTIIERNVSHESLKVFKKSIYSEMIVTGKNIEARYPSVAPGKGAQVLMWLYGLIIGFRNLSEPMAMTDSLIQSEDLAYFRFDFVEQYKQAVHALLSGLS